MKVWLVKDSEQLPVEENPRRMRTWMLGAQLALAGHEVLWWSSNFSHFRKRLVSSGDKEIEVEPGLTLQLLKAGSYRSNISPARFLHHFRMAWRVAREFPRRSQPDVIVCCYPIIEVALMATLFARVRGIPILVDVRDFWPDDFLELLPQWIRPLGRVLFAPYFWAAGKVFRNSSGVVAISEGALRWALAYAGRGPGPLDLVVYHACMPLKVPEHCPPKRVREWLGLLEGKVVFCYSGTFSTAYDLKIVARTAKRLHESGNDRAHFLLLGEGTTYQDVCAACQGLPNVTLSGWVEQSELPFLLQRADIGLLPWCKADNAMPNKIFEYLSAGMPILSSATGDPARLLERHGVGLTYQAGDDQGLESLVHNLCEQEQERERMAVRAVHAFHEHFQSQVVYGRYRKHVEKAASSTSVKSLARGHRPVF